MSKFIYVGRGKVTIVDDEDYEYLSKYNWCVTPNGYVQRHKIASDSVEEKSHVYMHRSIMKPKNGNIVDHINRDRLDNRKENLRICTYSQNSCNKSVTKSNLTSKYKGVTYVKRLKHWQVQISNNLKTMYVGVFKTEKEAALAYNKAALKFHGEFACLNEVV